MDQVFEEPFEGLKASDLKGKSFDACTFTNCDFSEANLSSYEFMECEFHSCNLSMATLQNTGVKDVNFVDCKLTGVDFSQCNDFLFNCSFSGCILDYSSFLKRKLPKTKMVNCSVREADFVEADFSGTDFSGSDLSLTAFERTNVEKADFRTATGFSIHPELNRIRGAKFSSDGLRGLLEAYNLVIE